VVERVAPNALSSPRPFVSRLSSLGRSSAFTLVEMLIGLSLGLIIISAVLSSYTYLGRNLARLVNQQTLESQARRTLLTIEQDVRAANGISSPTATGIILTNIPSSLHSSGKIDVTYSSSTYVDSSTGATYYKLTRSSTATGSSAQVLLYNLVDFGANYPSYPDYVYGFKYYDSTGQAYNKSDLAASTTVIGIKQISLVFLSSTGSATNGTKTPNYYGSSPRLALRNSALLQ